MDGADDRRRWVQMGAEALPGGTVYQIHGDPPGFPGAMNSITAEMVLAAVLDDVISSTRRQVAEEIARSIERMAPAHPRTWNRKWLVGRRMAANEARRVGGVS